MRKASVAFGVMVAMLFFANTLLAGNVEKGADGSLRVRVKEIIYSPVDITVSKEALSHEMEWKRAVETPGVIVPLIITEAEGQSQMVDFFHHKTIMVAKTGIVFDEKSKVVEMVKDREVGEKVFFNPYFIFWGVSLLSMLVVNILYFKRNLTTTFATIFFAAFATIFAIAAFATTAAVAPFFAALAATALFVDSTCDDNKKSKKTYIIFSAIYYALMCVGVISMVASM